VILIAALVSVRFVATIQHALEVFHDSSFKLLIVKIN
jgi:hypothetical protein